MTTVDADKPVQPTYKLKNPNDVRPVALTLIKYSSNSKGSLLVAYTSLLEITYRGSNQGSELTCIYMLRVTIVAQGNRGSCFIEFIKRVGEKR